jgi:hypothetical protein
VNASIEAQTLPGVGFWVAWHFRWFGPRRTAALPRRGGGGESITGRLAAEPQARQGAMDGKLRVFDGRLRVFEASAKGFERVSSPRNCDHGEWDKVWEVARSGVTPGVAMPELNEAAARKSSNPANPRTGQHGSANSCLPRFVPTLRIRLLRAKRSAW